MSERVRIDIDGHVATVALARPEKHNALDPPMFDGIIAATERLAADPSLRAVVLHGEGPSFCSGLDIMATMAAGGGLEALSTPLRGAVPNRFQRVADEWRTLPAPVIAAIHGNCFGGGLQIALAADIRICAPGARLSVMEVKWGLVPDMSLTRTLPRLTRIDVAKELTFTGRVVSGEEAHSLGLVTHLADDPLAAARALAGEIAERSPDAVRRAKRLLEQSWTADAPTSLALEARLQAELIGSANQLEAVRAGMAREPGKFADPQD